MKISKLWLFMIALIAIGLIGLTTPGFAAHPGTNSLNVDASGNITLLNASGAAIAKGSAVPYSPKQTCGVSACHNYESNPTTVSKQQTVGGVAGVAYNVTVPTHGVTTGYHFQQGMNVPWGQTQRDFYGLPSFTSSPGMVGKY